MKRTESRLFIGAILGLFVLGLFMQSCSSSTNSPVSSDLATPIVSASSNSDLVVPDFSISGINTDVVAMDPYPPGGGKDTTVKGGGRDTTVKGGGSGNGGSGSGDVGKGGPRMRPLPIPCLGLDSAQMVLLRQLMNDAAAASKSANEAYRLAMAPIRSADSAAMAAFRDATKDLQKQLMDMQKSFRQQAQDIMAQLKSGAIDRATAKAQLDALKTQFQNDSKAIRDQIDQARQALRLALTANDAARKAANDQYQAALKAVQADLNSKIAGILTPDQLIKWNLWLSGVDPCRGPKK